jgi:hypothetical protein
VVVETHHVGRAPREGEIIEILPGRAGDHFRVRWDGGGETILFPDSDCVIIAADPGRALRAIADARRLPEIDLRPSGVPIDAKMDVWFDEDDKHTEARVTLHLRDYQLTGFGQAQRHPHDPNVPAVGEELAVARALSDLSHQLLDLATYQIEKREGHPIHVDL